MEIKNIKETSCSCDKCKNMCRTAPCLGTPEDIIKICEAGFQGKIALTGWATGLVMGVYHKPITMLQAKFENGKCSFLDDNDLCILHDLGLKPTEGKLAHHNE